MAKKGRKLISDPNTVLSGVIRRDKETKATTSDIRFVDSKRRRWVQTYEFTVGDGYVVMAPAGEAVEVEIPVEIPVEAPVEAPAGTSDESEVPAEDAEGEPVGA